MKLKVKKESYEYEFGSLKTGEIFKYYDEVYIKSNNPLNENAMSLEDGIGIHIEKWEKVIVPLEEPILTVKFAK